VFGDKRITEDAANMTQLLFQRNRQKKPNGNGLKTNPTGLDALYIFMPILKIQ
jgi:hypothetical protein